MERAADSEARKIGYSRARLFLLGIGLGVLALIAAMMLARGVDRVEVLAILLFIPVFVAFVFWNEKGGIVAAVLAAITYGAARYQAIQTVGLDPFIGLLASRSLAYLLFGALGGWANSQLETSLTKLELYDQIDDATGLFNSRFFLQDTDLEVSRSQRYQTLFSVAYIEVPASSLEALSRRQKAGVLKELGRLLRESVRTVDRAVHGRGKDSHLLAVVLPETGKEGAEVFARRLGQRVEEYLVRRGVPPQASKVTGRSVVYPGDEDGLNDLRAAFIAIDQEEHPEDIVNR